MPLTHEQVKELITLILKKEESIPILESGYKKAVGDIIDIIQSMLEQAEQEPVSTDLVKEIEINYLPENPGDDECNSSFNMGLKKAIDIIKTRMKPLDKPDDKGLWIIELIYGWVIVDVQEEDDGTFQYYDFMEKLYPIYDYNGKWYKVIIPESEE